MCELKIDDGYVHLDETPMFAAQAGYIPFPTNIEYDKEKLMPLALVQSELVAGNSGNEILLAFPATESLCEEPFFSYSFVDGVWKIDNESQNDYEYEIENHAQRYNTASAFYSTHGYLNYHRTDDSSPDKLAILGGQPPLGGNWDAYLRDEGSDEYDELFDAGEEVYEKGENASEEAKLWVKKSIILEDDGIPYAYVASIKNSLYTEDSADLIFFYNAEQKRVLVCADYS